MMHAMPGRENNDEFAAGRERMLRWDLQGRDITDPRILAVMGEVPREEFLPASQRSQAYHDGPLPIGSGQTISQPYIVALMTQHLRLNQSCNVLEIGTGCGYQTAVLCRLARKVFTIERFSELAESAQAVLGGLRINNVEFHVGDGSCGWPEARLPKSGCFDRVMVTAAVPAVPEPVARQLREGGLIVVPIGAPGVQELVVCEKKADKLVEKSICDVRFVKLIGKYGFEA